MKKLNNIKIKILNIVSRQTINFRLNKISKILSNKMSLGQVKRKTNKKI